MQKRKLMVFIATSLDGYIATPEGSIDFLKIVQKEGEDYGYSKFKETVDTIIIGRKTFDQVNSMGFEYPHTEQTTYVITRSSRPDNKKVKFYTGNIKELIIKLQREEGKNLYCDGGAEIIDLLIHADLIDEYIISVIPILLGNGISLFKQGRPEQKLELLSSKSFEKGLIQMHYKRIHFEQHTI